MPSTGPAIACTLKDCANIELPAISDVSRGYEEIKAPIRLRSAMAEILKVHNSLNLIKPQDIEGIEKSGSLNDLKADDETIVSEIIALTHEVHNADEF